MYQVGRLSFDHFMKTGKILELKKISLKDDFGNVIKLTDLYK
jgi:hypothetical protein